MLAVVAFSMSMIGTFLVRSGILTSVHAFAVDPQRGAFILVLLALYIGGALALFGAARRHGEGGLDLRARSAARARWCVNNLLLSVILGIVFIGTLYPLVDAGARARSSRSARLISTRSPGRSRWSWSRSWRWGRCCAGAATGCASWRGRIALPVLLSARWPCSRWSCSRPASASCPCSAWSLALGVGAASLAPLVEAQPAPHAALHLGHGDRPSRHRRQPRRHGVGKRLHQGDAGRRAARRDRRGRALHASASTASSRSPGPNWTAIEAQARPPGAATARRSCCGRRRGCSARRRPPTSEAAIATRWTASSTPCSARRTSRGAGSCGCGGSRSSP